MSIENRLAAKKRSAQARRNAKIKSALELGVIILIPVAILVIVLLIWRSSIPRYSRGLDSKGSIKRYSLSDNVVLADLDNMGIEYDKYKPTDAEVDAEMLSKLKSKVEAEKAAESGGEEKEAVPSTSTSSDNETSADDDDKQNAPAPTDGSDTVTTGADDKTDGTTDGDSETMTDDDYRAMFTDENMEKYFKEVLGEKYAHTVDGFRSYITDTLQLANFNKSAADDILKYLEDESEIKELPSDSFMKNWTEIMKVEMKQNYEYYDQLYTSLGMDMGKTLYEFYDNRGVNSKLTQQEYFESYAKLQAEARVKDTILLLAAFDKLGLTYSQSEVDAFVDEHYTSKDEAVKEYGSEYLALSWRAEMAMEELMNRIHKTEDTKAAE